MIFQVNCRYRFIGGGSICGYRFFGGGGGGAPALQPTPIQPTRQSAEVTAARRDIEERKRISSGRAESIMSVPGLATTVPNLSKPVLKDKLG